MMYQISLWFDQCMWCWITIRTKEGMQSTCNPGDGAVLRVYVKEGDRNGK